ncbi:hypothetical protein PVL29_003768 [Vitis rotundifolia]|uniref:Uncharacterized protein n=1 Tax=Vitis rotundifolia TaxID=103349 RepID=A0AA39AEY7_VITRO|nr:hypothetical protein PVL29_003768 [Vitis rotundifolia]
MWYHHLYVDLSSTAKQRIASWDNYCSFFFQCRAKMKNKAEQKITLLRQYDQAWNVYGVLNFLQAGIDREVHDHSDLEQEKERLEYTRSNVLKVLRYFSMVGLLRVHCLLGDYHTGLKCLLPIDISQPGVYTSIIGSHITTIYHFGFANLMLRRYTKQFHQKSPKCEQLLKKNEQMYALLVICLSLSFALYDELFSYACPKFITPYIFMHGHPPKLIFKAHVLSFLHPPKTGFSKNHVFK